MAGSGSQAAAERTDVPRQAMGRVALEVVPDLLCGGEFQRMCRALLHMETRMGRRGRDVGYPTPPAQIPACSFPAPGSSQILASAISEKPRRVLVGAAGCL
jgi:hypothetical protein